MSLFSALTVAVGGLNAQSQAIGNISDNISNTSTIGFKRIDTRFESLVTESSLESNSPGGVRATPAYQNNIQGNLISSQTSTNLAISGAGFFAVRRASSDATSTTTFTQEDFYTRRGDFNLNKDGYLVNGSGYYLVGYSVNSATLAVDTSQANPIQISALLDNPVATSGVDYAANLPAGAVTGSAFPTSTILVYDSLGNTHPMEFTWTKAAGTNDWTLDLDVDDAAVPLNRQMTFNFNSAAPAGTLNTITNAGGSGPAVTIIPPVAPDNQALISFTLDFGGAGTQTVTVDFGNYDLATGVTQFADDTISVTSLEQNGIPRGSFQDVAVDEDGFVTLNYDNGRSRTLFQIPIVQFFAPNNLQRQDGGAFSRTVQSGTPRFSAPGTVGAGTIVSSSLEGSNVDIADEFTKMIQSQRIYSANARTITTTNSMLEEVINVVR